MSKKFDIFISHVKQGAVRSWESNLVSFLETLINRIAGNEIAVAKSSGFESEEAVFEAINSSRIFVLILSHEYLTETSSANELSMILNLPGDLKNRVFKVLKTEVQSSVLPEKIRNLIPYNFFEPTGVRVDSSTLIESHIFEIERHYWTKLTDLAFDIFTVLKIETLHAIDVLPSVYIAETTPDQEKNRDSIIRELKRLGFKIYPNELLPVEKTEFEKKVLGYLEDSFLSVHIFGNNYGPLIEGSEFSAPDYQNRLAAEYYDEHKNTASGPFSRLIWLSPDIKIQNERQRLFLEQLKRDADILKGASLIQTPLEYFKTIIMTEVGIYRDKPDIGLSAINKGVRVYLIHESTSFEKISEISSYLSGHGFEIIHSPLLTEEKNLLKKHRKNLTESDAVLIFFDTCDDFWLKSKINDTIKAPGFGRTQPFLAKAVLVDCPCSVSKEYFEQRGVLLIQSLEEFSPFPLSAFVDKIQMSYV